MTIHAKVKHDKALGAFTISFKFEKWQYRNVEAMAGVFKMVVPSSAREYNPATKEWTILEPFWKPIKDLLAQSQNFVIEEEKLVNPEDFFYNQGVASDAPISREELANMLLSMLGITAEELSDSNKAKRAFRRKALEWHPDRNPENADKMSELNSVWTAYNNNVVN